ncbi:hypothetical protein [Streptomyces griseorubiginosus]
MTLSRPARTRLIDSTTVPLHTQPAAQAGLRACSALVRVRVR